MATYEFRITIYVLLMYPSSTISCLNKLANDVRCREQTVDILREKNHFAKLMCARHFDFCFCKFMKNFVKQKEMNDEEAGQFRGGGKTIKFHNVFT